MIHKRIVRHIRRLICVSRQSRYSRQTRSTPRPRYQNNSHSKRATHNLFFTSTTKCTIVPRRPTSTRHSPSRRRRRRTMIRYIFTITFRHRRIRTISRFTRLPSIMSTRHSRARRRMFRRSTLHARKYSQPKDVKLLQLRLKLQLGSKLLQLNNVQHIQVNRKSFFPEEPSLL